MADNIRSSIAEVRSVAAGAIPDIYTGVGLAFDSAIRIFHIQNLTNGKVMLSVDGVDDYIPVPIHGYLTLDACWNKTSKTGALFEIGERFYVKRFATFPTVGSFYITGFY